MCGTYVPVASLDFTIVRVEQRTGAGWPFRLVFHSLLRHHSEMGFGVERRYRKIRAERRGGEVFVSIKKESRGVLRLICRGKERSRGKPRERIAGGKKTSLMLILQPVQRGLVFRRARRSAGAFCRPFKPTVFTMINKHGSPPLLPLQDCHASIRCVTRYLS